MTVRTWKIKGLYKEDPEEVAKELDALGEKFTPHDVVENARRADSVMHNMFEWDDAVAGEKYREQQAQLIIRLIVATPSEPQQDQEPVRIYVSTGEQSREYAPVRLFVRNEDQYQDLLNRALRDLEAFKRKYATLAELDKLIELIDELI